MQRILYGAAAVFFGLLLFTMVGQPIFGSWADMNTSDRNLGGQIRSFIDELKANKTGTTTQGDTGQTTTTQGGSTTTTTQGGTTTTQGDQGQSGTQPSLGGQAPQDATTAASVLGVPANQVQYLKPEMAGTNSVQGWILGDANTQSQGLMLNANTLPAGACVDYDPGSSTVTGGYKAVISGLNRQRVLMTSPGSFNGLKSTIYWGSCNAS